MFRVPRDRTFRAIVPVKLRSPDSPGEFIEGSFTATFRALPRSEYEKGLPDRQFLERILVAVDGIGGEDGEYPADEQRAMVIDDLELALAAVLAFSAAYTEKRVGN
jgi:hypothetical protein